MIVAAAKKTTVATTRQRTPIPRPAAEGRRAPNREPAAPTPRKIEPPTPDAAENEAGDATMRRIEGVYTDGELRQSAQKDELMNETITLLKHRRSAPPAIMTGPGPSPDELTTMLTVASRVPDHGKLAPWRFIVVEGDGRDRAGRIALDIRLADKPDLDDAGRAAELGRFVRAPLVVGVVSRAAPHVKIPEWEQILSAGAVCMSLIVAARALSYSATWLTGWPAYDARFREALGLAEHERIAGFIHVGRAVAIEDRPRPPLDEIVTKFPA
jgi:nitroreductase